MDKKLRDAIKRYHPWDYLLQDLKDTGKLYQAELVRQMELTYDPMPVEIQRYLADVLAKRSSFMRGAPRDRFKSSHRHMMHHLILPLYQRYAQFVKHVDPKRTSIGEAFIELFAKKHGWSKRELHEVIYLRK